jgi:hypothetical protein
MDKIIDITHVQKHMIGYVIVSEIFDVRDSFYFDDQEPTEYKELSLNLKVFDAIREVNFIFSKDVGILEDIKERKKIGILMNFEVYLDPSLSEDIVILHHPEKEKVEIKIKF